MRTAKDDLGIALPHHDARQAREARWRSLRDRLSIEYRRPRVSEPNHLARPNGFMQDKERLHDCQTDPQSVT